MPISRASTRRNSSAQTLERSSSRHDDARLQRWRDCTATADANGTTNAVIPPVATTVKTILCASCGKHGADGDTFCRGCGAPLATNVDESAPRDALSAASAV